MIQKSLSILLLVSSISYAAEQPFEHRQVPTTTTTTSDCQELSEEDAQYLEQLFQEKFPLHAAAYNGNEIGVRLLIRSKKFDVNQKNYTGYTPLCEAAFGYYHHILNDALFRAGVPNMQKNNQFILLIQELILAGTRINEKNIYGETVLHWAAKIGHLPLVKVLLEAGAHVNEKTQSGNTPLHYALDDHRNLPIVKELLKACNVNEKNNDGMTPLHCAVLKGHHDVVQVLLDCPLCNVNEKDNDDRTPLDIAKKNGHRTIKYLIKHWDSFVKGLHFSWCKSILVAQHQCCGAQSPISIVINHDCFQQICSYLQPGCCIYTPEQIKFYVELAQRFEEQSGTETCGICMEKYPVCRMATPGNCKHLFCISCFRQYTGTARRIEYQDGSSAPIVNNVCPICRAPIAKNKN